jgi:hypothetical protein
MTQSGHGAVSRRHFLSKQSRPLKGRRLDDAARVSLLRSRKAKFRQSEYNFHTESAVLSRSGQRLAAGGSGWWTPRDLQKSKLTSRNCKQNTQPSKQKFASFVTCEGRSPVSSENKCSCRLGSHVASVPVTYVHGPDEPFYNLTFKMPDFERRLRSRDVRYWLRFKGTILHAP